ncbi:DUF2247 family protein [Pseudomonas sp. nanlin1]|uniref:DUF2247 family protein n=1 Tax=Pseudomonas sp. nanlin1 TaxID=3040605 RepID=UPI00388FF7FB
MSQLDVLTDLNLASWSTIFVGYTKHWINREDIFEYAMSQLLNGCDSENVAIIAGGKYLNDEEILDIISKQINIKDFVVEMDKWRLAFLVCIDQSNDSDEKKLKRLQEIYADFDYPEDMASCSVYSQDGIAPLVAMSQVVKRLKEKLSGR